MEIKRLHHPLAAEFKTTEPIVLALGFFDGVHRGHQAVIREAAAEAKKRGIKCAVMTFDPHPSMVLSKVKKTVKYLTPLAQKGDEMAKLDVDILYVTRFTSHFSSLLPEEFVQQYISELGAVHVVAGFDYSYGKFGAGKMEQLAEYGNGQFEVTTVGKLSDMNDKVSSTVIRRYLNEGDMEAVTKLLGRPYETKGTVIHGDKRGRTIGFPTANILTDHDLMLPPIGVYATRILVNGVCYESMTSVGYNITFKDEKILSTEVYILDFNDQIYGEEVIIEWHKYFRPELKFNGIEGLVEQLKLDEINTRDFFNGQSKDN
ncbi:MAG: riboflavin biosynthesis protein RibF [Brochothrix thermosphacta]|uniref:riboflavin biosynthesis protein RibF n=1 Tax=Brochothrix thermosphacta TaxID=2756 RepID=UPI000E72EA87|nr:riboflavin biosynthesis protein RibF [Brochothrix thermosphacta]ANZ97666.1 riboflavin biosynthesis protein RibF [Brochothrix thermosphacta]